jgi:hypothetical protein
MMLATMAVNHCLSSSGLASAEIRALRNAWCAARLVTEAGTRRRVLSLRVAGADLSKCSHRNRARETGDYAEFAQLIHQQPLSISAIRRCKSTGYVTLRTGGRLQACRSNCDRVRKFGLPSLHSTLMRLVCIGPKLADCLSNACLNFVNRFSRAGGLNATGTRL